MWLRIVVRLLISLGTAWAKLTAILVILHALPPRTQNILAGDIEYSALYEAVASKWDNSLLHQYLEFLFRIFQGGQANLVQQQAVDVVSSKLLPVIELAFSAGLLAILFSATTLALFVVGGGYLSRRIVLLLNLAIAPPPSLWLGTLLLVGFSFHRQWSAVMAAESWPSLLLLSMALALPTIGLLAPVLSKGVEMAGELSSVTRLDPHKWIFRMHHAVRSTLLPMVTLGGWLTAGLFGSTMIIEPVFGRPVLGAPGLGPVLTYDIPAVLIVILHVSFVYLAASLLLEILWAFVELKRTRAPTW